VDKKDSRKGEDRGTYVEKGTLNWEARGDPNVSTARGGPKRNSHRGRLGKCTHLRGFGK